MGASASAAPPGNSGNKTATAAGRETKRVAQPIITSTRGAQHEAPGASDRDIVAMFHSDTRGDLTPVARPIPVPNTTHAATATDHSRRRSPLRRTADS